MPGWLSDVILVAVRCCVLALFAMLVIRSYLRWGRGGGAAAGWLGACFAVLAVVSVAGIVSADELGRGQGSWPWKLTAAVLLLFPYCLTRFTTSFRPAPRLPAVCGGVTALVIGWTLAMPGPHPGGRPPFFRAYVLVVLVVWTVFSLLAAGSLWSSARAEVSIARRRMRTLSAGSLLVVLAVLTRALALPSAPEGAQVAVQIFGLVSAWLFFAGFTPPRSLRAVWRRRELAGFHRAQAELITAFDPESVGRVIVAQAVQLLGAGGAFMTAADGRLLASIGIDPREAAALAEGTEPGVVRVPLGDGWLGVQASPATPFFGLDENELLQALCVSAGLALDRAELFARDRSNRDALEHLALHDSLTGLPNRALLLDRLAQAAARADRQPTRLAVLFLDLDRFKVVNDGLGHRAGDELLQAVADRLSAVVRPGDTVARLGGDEFVVLCEDLAADDQAVHLAERIAAAVRRPVTVSEREVAITASIGIVVADAGAVAPEALLRDADTAMYQAKERGRARFELFDAPARKRVMERLETEVALRRAVDRGELRLHYQPEISFDDGRILGIEALLRWEHPERGLLLPGEFLALAEETGLIVPMGDWALEEACRTAVALRRAHGDRGSLVTWVNLSGRQLVRPDLPERIGRILAGTGMDPTMLGLEITESVIMEDTRRSGETLRTLKRLGLRIAIDDFGTGFSSLSRLRSFPVDVLKVDRSFVAGIGRDEEDSVIVRAVIGLAHSLGMTAVAEGVETLEQSAALRAMGCDTAQGFYFSRPVEAQDLAPLLLPPPDDVGGDTCYRAEQTVSY